MQFKQLALALVLAGSLTGCGAAGTGYAPLGTQTADLSKAESDVLDMLNGSALDDIESDALEGAADAEPSQAAARLQTQSLFAKGSTRVGRIRMTDDGRCWLQVRQGLIRKKENAYPLEAADATMKYRLEGDLNASVVVRGTPAATTPGATISVTAVYRVPSLSTVTNLLKTGTAKGHVFMTAPTMSSTPKVGLSDVVVTYKSVDSGYVYRTICKADGSYRVMFLPPGDYVASGIGTAEARVKIQKLKVAQVDLYSK